MSDRDTTEPVAEPADVEAVEPTELDIISTRYGVPAVRSRGQLVLHPSRDVYLDLVTRLKADGYLMCIDLTAADYLTHEGGRELPAGVETERYEVVANLINHRERSRVRLRVQVPADDPRCPSLWSLHVGVENPEREVFDMFGIVFDEHPDMTRILMPESWQGHPLRKDHALGRIPVQFKGAPSAR